MTKNDLAPNGNSKQVENAGLCVCKDPAYLGDVHPKLISWDTWDGDWIGGGHQNLTSQGLFLSFSLFTNWVYSCIICVTKNYIKNKKQPQQKDTKCIQTNQRNRTLSLTLTSASRYPISPSFLSLPDPPGSLPPLPCLPHPPQSGFQCQSPAAHPDHSCLWVVTKSSETCYHSWPAFETAGRDYAISLTSWSLSLWPSSSGCRPGPVQIPFLLAIPSMSPFSDALSQASSLPAFPSRNHLHNQWGVLQVTM